MGYSFNSTCEFILSCQAAVLLLKGRRKIPFGKVLIWQEKLENCLETYKTDANILQSVNLFKWAP